MPTSTPVQPTITAAGLAAVFNAESTGVEFAISHIAFGTGQYTPDGTETALHVEKVRVPIAGGGRISPTQIQIYAIAQAVAGNPFFVGEVGFFGDSGATLLAVYSSTGTPNLFLSDTVSTSVSYALGLAALPASSVTVTIDPSASAALLIMGAHVAAADPHPQYVQKVNGVAFYDATVTFNLNAQIIGDDGLVYQSIQANNIAHPPSSSPTWWVPLYNYGDTPVTGLAAANVTLSSTQAARAHITLSGALTANINVIFPNWVKEWAVVNNTTGAFTVTCKTSAGTGVTIPQDASPTKIRGDGTNLTQPPENIAPAIASQHAVQLGQVQSLLLGASAITSISSPTGLTVANAGQLIVITAAVAAGLPLASTVSAGKAIEFFSTIAGATAVRNTTDTFTVNGTTATALALNAGDTATLVSNGVNGWYVVAGSVLAQYATAYSKFCGVGGSAQTIQTLTGSRAITTSYTNNTALPIFVMASVLCTTAGTISAQLNSAQIGAHTLAVNGYGGFQWLVPPGATYGLAISTGAYTLNQWAEIR